MEWLGWRKGSLLAAASVVVIAAALVWRGSRESPGAQDPAEARRKMESLQARHPALAIKTRVVPDERNAWLQMQRLADDAGGGSTGPALSPAFRDFLSQEKPPDEATAVAYLAEHAPLVERLEKILSLPQSSSAQLALESFFVDARPGKDAADLFLLRARLAAMAGDEAEALRNVRLSRGVADLYHTIETPMILSETVAVLVRLSVISRGMKDILPALGSDANLDEWRRVFSMKDASPAALARVMRGEWYAVAGSYLVPQAVGIGDPHLPDPGAYLEAWTEEMAILVSRLPSMSFGQILAEGDLLRNFGERHRLSRAGKKAAEDLRTGMQAWVAGYARHAVIAAQAEAVLEVLAREKLNQPVVSGPLEWFPPDPVSGRPFHFDAGTRRLIASQHSKIGEVEPMKLPW